MNKFILLILILGIHSSFTMDFETILNEENVKTSPLSLRNIEGILFTNKRKNNSSKQNNPPQKKRTLSTSIQEILEGTLSDNDKKQCTYIFSCSQCKADPKYRLSKKLIQSIVSGHLRRKHPDLYNKCTSEEKTDLRRSCIKFPSKIIQYLLKCPYCTQQFKSISSVNDTNRSLKAHIKSKHKNIQIDKKLIKNYMNNNSKYILIDLSDSSQSIQKIWEGTLSENDKKQCTYEFSCSQCNTTNPIKNLLRNRIHAIASYHLRKEHPNLYNNCTKQKKTDLIKSCIKFPSKIIQYLLKCPYCTQQFKSILSVNDMNRSLKAHIKSKHKNIQIDKKLIKDYIISNPQCILIDTDTDTEEIDQEKELLQ